MQTFLMVLIAGLCFVSAGNWLMHAQAAAGLSFIGFGLGYVGLAILFQGGS